MPDISDWCPDHGGNAHYGLLRSVNTGALQGLTYDYDAKGNVASLIDGRNSNETILFSYDHLDRLTSATSALFSESYAYNAIGTFQSKGGVNYGYPSGGSPRPHAPTAVGGNTYSYDNNGNLTAAEGRTYTYDVENRLTQVHEGGSQLRSFAYDGDGTLRSRADSGSTVMHYITPDYQVNPSTGEATVFYRFGGRAVARRTNSGLLYILADHLSSSQAEVQPNQAEAGQRRNYPFGTDRPVSGANDIVDDERYTSQKRMEAGNGNPKRELYHYGARWYLPGVGIFTQPDSIVPDYQNPQSLNRFSYCVNNPLKYTDPTGHDYDDDYWGGIPVPGEDEAIWEETPASVSDDEAYWGGIPVPGDAGANADEWSFSIVAGIDAYYGPSDNETANTLAGIATALDMTAATVSVGLLAPAAVALVLPGGQPAAVVLAGSAVAVNGVLGALSTVAQVGSDVWAGRTGVYSTDNSAGVRISSDTAISLTYFVPSAMAVRGAIAMAQKVTGGSLAKGIGVPWSQAGYDLGRGGGMPGYSVHVGVSW